MLDIKKLLCAVGMHSWQHLESHHIPTRECNTAHIKVIAIGRWCHYRICNTCGKIAQYYPSNRDSIDFIDTKNMD